MADKSSNLLRVISYPGAVVSTLAGSVPVVSPADGSVSFSAGDSTSAGNSDGTGTSASFEALSGVAVIPSSGTVVVADTNNNLIRLVTYPGGVVTTLAGSGSAGASDDVGTSASFGTPTGVAVIESSSSSGVIIVADSENYLVRVVTYPGAVVTTLAGNNGIQGASDGVGAAASFWTPSAVAVLDSRTIAVADNGAVADENGVTSSSLIRLVSYPGGSVTTLAGGGVGFSADGTGTSASFGSPSGLAVVPATGSIVVVDSLSNLVRLVTRGGAVSTLAGASSSSSYASGSPFLQPMGVAFVPSAGSLIVSDGSNLVLAVSSFSFAVCDAHWHHVALTYSASSGSSLSAVSAYVDGSFLGSAAMAVSLPTATASTLRVGYSGDLTTNSGSRFSGALSEVRIYARALTVAEVAALSQPPLLAVNNTRRTPASPTPKSTSYAYTCNLGFVGQPATLTQSAADGSWSWRNGVNATACTQCGPGFFVASTATATSCSTQTATCNAGSYYQTPASTNKDRVCAPCPAGTFSAAPSASTFATNTSKSCTTFSKSCPAGTYFAQPGSAVADVTCKLCPGGTFMASVTTVASAATCAPCAPGTYAPATGGASICTACAPGSFSGASALASSRTSSR